MYTHTHVYVQIHNVHTAVHTHSDTEHTQIKMRT